MTPITSSVMAENVTSFPMADSPWNRRISMSSPIKHTFALLSRSDLVMNLPASRLTALSSA